MARYEYKPFPYRKPPELSGGRGQRWPVLIVGAGPVGLSAAIDLAGLRGYWDAVIDGTLAVVDALAGEDLDAVVPADRVRRVASQEGGVAKGAEWLTEFWAKGRTRAWVLAQTPFLHAYGHSFEALAVRGMWGHPSL